MLIVFGTSGALALVALLCITTVLCPLPERAVSKALERAEKAEKDSKEAAKWLLPDNAESKRVNEFAKSLAHIAKYFGGLYFWGQYWLMKWDSTDMCLSIYTQEASFMDILLVKDSTDVIWLKQKFLLFCEMSDYSLVVLLIDTTPEHLTVDDMEKEWQRRVYDSKQMLTDVKNLVKSLVIGHMEEHGEITAPNIQQIVKHAEKRV
eukprot:GHVS01072433.1.p1 GENE.GHVS01072433.1~~GHVS01072433.1.p1  ORF type:complete len:206 (+),score=14.01 GHVS01072433.1:120-737(+)